jgi:23S rRNA pseudouridine2605 synthase
MTWESGKEHEESLAGERLARYLAHAGVASRRAAETLISAGRVQVNGIAITTQGARVDPARDQVTVDGRIVHPATRHVYVLLNKPAGYLSTVSDPSGRPTVLDLLPVELRQLRVYPVGRLDNDTDGLLLLTNDGDFALHLTHPRYSIEKHYEAVVQGYPTEAMLVDLRNGVAIREDNGQLHTTAPARVHIVRRQAGTTLLALAIHEGHKREIRRMLAAVGLTVQKLTRVGLGPLTLGGVSIGRWRYLSEEEVSLLLNK